MEQKDINSINKNTHYQDNNDISHNDSNIENNAGAGENYNFPGSESDKSQNSKNGGENPMKEKKEGKQQVENEKSDEIVDNEEESNQQDDDATGEDNETRNEEEISEDIRDEKFLELQARYDDINNRYLRLFSEFDNFRKRNTKEKLELTKTAAESVIQSLLPVLDDLDRAVESARKDNDQSSTKEGLEIILNKFKAILRQHGVEEINALGEDFNTDYHEAVTNVKAEDKDDKGKVVDVVQKGYLLNEKVLRFAKVIVAN